MYKKIVVPLDGSKLAEVVLPHLEQIADQTSEVFLVSVTEKIQGWVSEHGVLDRSPNQDFTPAPINVSGSLAGPAAASKRFDVDEVPMTMGKMAKTASDYLEKIAEDLEKKGLKVTISVLAGNPAEEIVRFADQQKADAIMIASRGKSGFSRWDLGNIAEKIVRASRGVVILVKPDADFKETKPKRKGKAI